MEFPEGTKGKTPRRSLYSLETLFFLSPLNRAFNLLEMMGKRGFQKIGRSIMGWRKYFALERRTRPPYPRAIAVEFYVRDEVTKKALTAKGTGRLVNIRVHVNNVMDQFSMIKILDIIGQLY